MVHGKFSNNTPLVRVAVLGKDSVQTPTVILDTGFTGDLQITPKIAGDLQLDIAGVTPVQVANGEMVNAPFALTIAAMEGEIQNVQAIIQEGVPLLCISFLSKFRYTATLDCSFKTVTLERRG